MNEVISMMYKNYVAISNTNNGCEYIKTIFNEDCHTSDYEIIDIDLASIDIGREIVDKLNKKDSINDYQLDKMIFEYVDRYLNHIRNKLIDNIDEYVSNNIECEIKKY